MRLTIDVHAPTLYAQLLDDATRREFERALTLVCRAPVRVTAMQDGGKTWQRGGNGDAKRFAVNRPSGRDNVPDGNGRRKVAVDVLPDEAYPEGATCNIFGGG